jgi:hypothetical protein
MTTFTAWVTEMFTFPENGYTVAMAFQQLIVEIQWLPLTKIGFLMVEEPSRRTLPSRSRRPCRLTTLATHHAPPRWLSRCLSSCRRLPSAGASHCGIAFCASCPSGWLSRLLASHAATYHLPAPPPLIAPSPLVTPLSGLSSGWLRRRLSSRLRHLSAG